MLKLSTDTIRNICFFVLSLFACCGCNKDAFLEKLSISQENITLTSGSDSITIGISMPHWEISNVQFLDSVNQGFSYKIRDVHTEPFSNIFPPSLRGIYLEDRYKYVLERTIDNRLKVVAGENLLSHDIHFKVQLTDGIQIADILITQRGGLKYEVDSLYFKLIPQSVLEYVSSQITDLRVTADTVRAIPVLEDVFSYGRFICDYPIGYQVLGEDLMLNTPLTISKDGSLVLDGGKKHVSIYGQRGKRCLNTYQKLTLRKNVANEIIRNTAYITYAAAFKCFVHSKMNGVSRIITGQYRSISPIVEKSSVQIRYNEKEDTF